MKEILTELSHHGSRDDSWIAKDT